MFDLLDQHQVNELHVRYDARSGLKSFIAIHSTLLGPALGGCRFVKYSNESEALADVLSLARGMSYKAALAEVPQGGGKSVIMVPEGNFDRSLIFSEFGRFVESLSGRYITAIDSGTTASEMDVINRFTSHVTSTSGAGNPSPYTAKGVFEGIKSSVRFKLGNDSLSGLRVAIQGIGNVGYDLGRMLTSAGAEVIVSDINEKRVAQALSDFAIKAVSPDDIIKEPCVVFAPCGLSNVVRKESIDQFKCRIIAGSANVQLESPELGQRLYEKGILYAPDYVINSGGLIYASLTHTFKNKHQGDRKLLEDTIAKKLLAIGDTLTNIYQRSDQEDVPTSKIADILAEEKLISLQDQAA